MSLQLRQADSLPVSLHDSHGALESHAFPVGRLPDLSDPDDMAKLGAEAFAFVNLARFAVPVRLGLAISTAPWIKDNIIDKYFPPKEPDC